MPTKIEWADERWNPVTGCTKISEGCQNCYAEGIANRFWGDRQFADIQCHYDRLDIPKHWRKPRKIIVPSMGDLFHKRVSDKFIVEVWDTMLRCPQHTFIVLTKRPERARWLISAATDNIWIGVSAENQEMADRRIPVLLEIPSRVRFVSVEPILDSINLIPYLHFDLETCRMNKLDWVICGGETGKKYRPMDIGWAKDIRNQCKNAGVPFFFKKVDQYRDTPEDLMIREWPQ